ncbi:MAG TPA: RIP metalloprotease RseP, partial [Burkholderiaceae bacterium]|nr:RIP metalloprotease RseP [Burkholderiaceae bacterium]
MSTLQTLVAFLAALTLLIFVHELGHYLVARWCDVKVLRFSIGFGKPLFTWRVGPDRTEWTIAAVPLGGYVRMLDERDAGPGHIPPEELPRAFTRKTLAQRSAIVVAGPLANFLLAIALYAAMGWVGTQEPAPVIDQPAAGTPAAAAQLQGGDRVLAVDGAAVRSWNDVRLKLLEPVIERRES